MTGDSGRAVKANKMKAEIYPSTQGKGGVGALRVIFTNACAVVYGSLLMPQNKNTKKVTVL